MRAKVTLVGDTGQPVRARLQLIASSNLPLAAEFQETAAGTFVAKRIPAGQYRVRVIANVDVPTSAGSEDRELWADAAVPVARGARARVTMALQRGFRLTGTVETPGGKPQEMAFESTGGLVSSSNYRSIAITGAFAVTDVLPGRYLLTANGAASHLAALKRNGTLLPSPVLDVAADVTGLDVTISETIRVTGSLLRSDGTPDFNHVVVLIPEDVNLRSRDYDLVRAVRPDTDGAFAITDVVPGRYVIAITRLTRNDDWRDPAYLRRVTAGGQTILISTASGPLRLTTPND